MSQGHPTTPKYPDANAPAKWITATYHRNTITKGAPPTIVRYARSKGADDKPITKGATSRRTYDPPPPMPNPTQTPTTSNDPIAPTRVGLVQPIHQSHTRSNNPFTILEDCVPDNRNKDIADDITIQASNQHGGAPFSPFIRQMLEPPRHRVCT